jgi:hypothetical protein
MQLKFGPHVVLIIGLAFVFGYFGIDKLITPLVWIGWIPLWMEGLLGMTRETWLSIIGIGEIFLAVLLLIPHLLVRKVAAALSTLHLLGILTQTGWNDVAVRDIGLLAAAVALFLLLQQPTKQS